MKSKPVATKSLTEVPSKRVKEDILEQAHDIVQRCADIVYDWPGESDIEGILMIVQRNIDELIETAFLKGFIDSSGLSYLKHSEQRKRLGL